MQKTVARLLEMKGFDVSPVQPDATVHAALKIMAGKRVRVLVVLEDQRLVGIVTMPAR